MSNCKRASKAVYVLVGKKSNSISARIIKFLSLQGSFERFMLVVVGRGKNKGNIIEVDPLPNPTGFLRVIGLRKIKSIMDRYLYFPSAGILYVRRMRKRVERCIREDLRQGKEVCLITSVPPHVVCLVGLYLKKKYPGICWIIDWRDLWSYDENYIERTPNIFRKRLLKLEKKFLNNCDINVTTNSYAKEVLLNHYHVSPQRVVSINQSFSSNDFIDGSFNNNNSFINSKNQEITVGFLGTLFKPPRVPGDKVLDAIRSVKKSGINVKLHHYGIDPMSVKNSHVYEAHGNVPYKEGLKIISQCDFLLLVLADLPNCRAVMSIKLPDYLLVNRPIIAIVPEPSAISDAIKKTGAGFVIPANQDWGVGLENLMREIIAGADIPKRNEEEIERYNWQKVSGRWMDVIDGHRVE